MTITDEQYADVIAALKRGDQTLGTIHVSRWCDGSTACAVETKPLAQHGHWRGGYTVDATEFVLRLLDEVRAATTAPVGCCAGARSHRQSEGRDDVTTYYEKRGRRYVPIAEDARFDALTEGHYLVVIKPGLRSMTRLVEPASGEVEAAIRVARVAMEEAMAAANRSSGEAMGLPTKEDKERAERAYQAWLGVMGERWSVSYRGVSMHDIVEAGIQALRKEMQK